MIDFSDVLKKIGFNIRTERSRKGLNQLAFARMMKVSGNYVGKVERGQQNLSIKKIVELANFLEVDVKELLKL